MNDLEIIAQPEWDSAFDEYIELFKKENHKEPTLVDLQNIIEILIKRFRAVRYLMQKI